MNTIAKPDMTPMEITKAYAQFAEDTVRVHYQDWKLAVHHLKRLENCERSRFFAQNPLRLNLLFLKDMRVTVLRESLEVVIAVQRKIKRCRREIKEWYQMAMWDHDTLDAMERYESSA